MGYVFAKISDLHIKLPKSGLYVLLKASDAPLGSFYNEHRDRSALLRARGGGDAGDARASICLDRNSSARFDEGWYEPNTLPPVARWMGARARIRFSAPTLSGISLDLTTHIPGLSAARPLGLELLLNGVRLCALSLFRYGWLELEFTSPEPLTGEANDAEFELEIRADRTWQPRPQDEENRDDRDISIAVCNIVVKR
jgi:hypothetical protein